MSRPEVREPGLWKNGRLWWMRVRTETHPRGIPRSTGTDDLRLANRIARTIRDLRENRPMWDLLERAASGDITLLVLYNAVVAGTTEAVRTSLRVKAQEAADQDLAPWVDRWEKEHLAVCAISDLQRLDYARQVRALLPLRASQFTEDRIKKCLLALSDPRSGRPLTGSTKRRYVVAWKLFYRYLRKRVVLPGNPFEDADWLPENGSPRATYWDHETVLDVLSRMSGDARVAMTLIFGTGIELGAALATTGADVGRKEPTVVARGTKGPHRESRTVFVRKWAWPEIARHVQFRTPMAPLFTASEHAIRDQFYEAQVAAKLIAEPKRSKNYKKLWRAVKPHTIHDARHTYAINTGLGLDGEPRQSVKYIAHQLGHADEQMVLRIYAKTNFAERLRLLELAEAQQAGQRAAQAVGTK